MNRRVVHVFSFAVIVAALSSFLMYRLLAAHLANTRAPAAAPARNTLLVAAHDLQIGSLISERDFKAQPWTAEVPETAFRDPQEVIGRGVIATLYKGEIILSGRLAPKGAGAGLAATIPIGKRAVALRVNEVVGLAGFVVPGMRVDVIISGNGSEESQTGTLTRTVLQNIQVLSAGQRIEHTVDGKPSDAQVVNLLVSPDQAEILSLAGGETRVQLVLRNPLDTKEESTHGTSLAKLFYGDAAYAPRPASPPIAPVERAASPPPKPEVRTTTVEIIHGLKKSEETFSSNGENK